MPCVGKTNAPYRPSVNIEALPPSPTALPIGAAHQACIRLNASVTTMAATPISTSLTASQRVRVMLWFQASRNVPVSSSRAISGAPQNMPMTAGATRMTIDAQEIKDDSMIRWSEWNRAWRQLLRKVLASPVQCRRGSR